MNDETRKLDDSRLDTKHTQDLPKDTDPSLPWMYLIEQLLTHLLHSIPADFLLLLDMTGHSIFTCGHDKDVDLATLSALIAGDLAASQQIAHITGEYRNYQMVLREGDLTNIFITDAGAHLILFVQVPGDVPLGLARMLIRKAAQRLGETITSPLSNMITGIELRSKDLADQFDHAIGDLFSE